MDRRLVITIDEIIAFGVDCENCGVPTVRYPEQDIGGRCLHCGSLFQGDLREGSAIEKLAEAINAVFQDEDLNKSFWLEVADDNHA